MMNISEIRQFGQAISRFTPCLCFALIGITAGFGCVDTTVVEDRASNQICIQKENLQVGEDEVVANEVLEVYVVETCSSPSRELVYASCDVQVSGSEITISSRFEYETPRELFGSGEAAVCVKQVAQCDLPALEEGSYSIAHGSATFTVEVPTAQFQDCETSRGWELVPSPQE